MSHPTLQTVTREIWAKTDPYHPLWCHLLDVAAVCERLIPYFGCPDDVPPSWVLYLSALHDIGKADPEFQVFDDSRRHILSSLELPMPSRKGEFRHESRSGRWVTKHLRGEKLSWGKYAAELAGDILKGHHGCFNPRGCTDDSVGFSRWEQIREELADVVADVLDLDSMPFAPRDFPHTDTTGVKMVAMIVLSDWIASNDKLFIYPSLDTSVDPQSYWQQARLEAMHAVSVLLLDRPPKPHDSNPLSFQQVWPGFTDLKPSQKALEQACLNGLPPGLAIIEAPMGEGKTESAVYLAEYWRKRDGLLGAYIALPTMATSNQMHERYAKFLRDYRPASNQPRLVHGMAWLIDEETPQGSPKTYGDDQNEEWLLAREWFAPAKRALIAPEAVGTIDQALMAALNVRHGFLRLLGLSSKVLIIDEVHAYDEYMTTILERLLSWCKALSIPVIMLSATLSKPQKKRLIEAYAGTESDEVVATECYPLVTSVPMDGGEARALKVTSQPPRTIKLQCCEGALDDARRTAELAAGLVKDGGCACVIVNTVKQAQAVFHQLKDLLKNEGERYLFHARFPAFRRNAIEEKVVGLFGKEAIKNGTRPKKAVLVATQVVEQSLDLDFDVMISQLAPIDLLLQRVGRLRRHKDILPDSDRIPEEVLYVLTPENTNPRWGDSKFVYGEHVLRRSQAILRDCDSFNLPQDFRPLIDTCYGDGTLMQSMITEQEQELAALAQLKDHRKRESHAEMARKGLIPRPSSRIFSLTEAERARNESDDATDNYFRLSTRLEGRTRSVLLLDDPALQAAAADTKAPDRDTMKRLFLNKVDVPEWWLSDTTPDDGFDPIIEGAKWLRGTLIIPTKSGVWRGRLKGKSFAITNDELTGVEAKEKDQ